MSDETTETQDHNDGTWSGLKKTIIGTLTTVIAGGGVWVSTILFGGNSEDKEEHKTEQTAPAPVIVNVQQNQENKQKVENGGNTVIRERVIEKQPAAQPAAEPVKPVKKEEDSW
jgi:flagellar basal body-associated protein FliL